MRARRKAVLGLGVISLSLATIPGFAASLGGLTGAKLAAGSAVVSACDTNGLTPGYTTVAGAVTAVTVSGIADPGCEGGQLTLTLANAAGAAIGASTPQTVATDAGTADNAMTVTVSPTPPASAVAAIHVVINGP